jgi:hypothetical protein
MKVTLAFDIERTGPTTEYDTIAIGASVVDETFHELDSLYLPAYFPLETQFEKNCLEFWNNNLEVLKSLTYEGELNKTQREKDIVTKFQEFREKWENTCKKLGHTLVLVSDNCVYDGGFINALIYKHLPNSLPIPFTVSDRKYDAFYETTSMKHVLKNILGVKTNKELFTELKKVVDYPPKKYSHTHNPAHDAYGIAFDYQLFFQTSSMFNCKIEDNTNVEM